MEPKNHFANLFREDSWAVPLLALAVLTIGALLLYTVYRYCTWLRPKRDPLPWLRLPVILGLIFLAGVSLVAAVPSTSASCKLLTLGPGLGYVLLLSGLLTRTVQLLLTGGARHMLLQWLLVLFVNLNQVIISIAWLLRYPQCNLNLNQLLLLLLYPGVLIGVVLLLAFKAARKLKVSSLFRQVVYTALATAFTGGVAGCWLGAASLLDDSLLPSCVGYGSLITGAIVAAVTLIPREDDDDDGKFNVYATEEEIYYETEKEAPPKAAKPRGTEKNLPIEPEIVIVPMVPTPGMNLPNLANVISEKLQQQHHRHHRPTPDKPFGTTQRDFLAKARQTKQPRRIIDIFGNAAAADAQDAARIGNREQAARESRRRPYNHRGWLY